MNCKTKSRKSRSIKLLAGLVEVSVTIDESELMKADKDKILKNR